MSYALEKMRAFFLKFPALEDLAEAELEEVYLAFRGLGYYSRAKNIHSGARFIQKNWPDSFPETYEELISIPSIGPYTAAAIASICFGQKKPAIDGNVKRIIARYCKLDQEINTSAFNAQASSYLEDAFSVSNENPGDLNEALMELGQKVCIVKNPGCIDCPIQKNCLAYRDHAQALLPVKKKQTVKKQVIWLNLIATCQNKVLLQRLENGYFLKSQWLFPSYLFFHEDQSSVLLIHPDTKDEFIEKIALLGNRFVQNQNFKRRSFMRHTITHHKISLFIENIPLQNNEIKLIKNEVALVGYNELKDYFVSNAMRKVLSLF